jgi:hypothetical protein
MFNALLKKMIVMTTTHISVHIINATANTKKQPHGILFALYQGQTGGL